MDGNDGVGVPKLDASPHEAVEAVLHLGVAPLHGVEVERGGLGVSDSRGGGPAAQPDSVGRSSDLLGRRRLLECKVGAEGVSKSRSPWLGWLARPSCARSTAHTSEIRFVRVFVSFGARLRNQMIRLDPPPTGGQPHLRQEI